MYSLCTLKVPAVQVQRKIATAMWDLHDNALKIIDVRCKEGVPKEETKVKEVLAGKIMGVENGVVGERVGEYCQVKFGADFGV